MKTTELLNGLTTWVAQQQPGALVWSVVILAVGVVLRKPIASACLWLLAAVMRKLGVVLSNEMRALVLPQGQAMTVCVAALWALDLTALPAGLAGGCTRVIYSVIVACVFSALFVLVPAISQLVSPPPLLERANIGRDWIEKIVQIVVAALGVASVLEVWGIEISSALTGLGVFGAALALAAQDFVRNFVAGIGNISERRFKVGDWIILADGDEGTVERIELRSTLLRRLDQGAAFIPNSDLSNARVVNFASRQHRRLVLEVPLRHDTASDQLHEIRAEVQAFVLDSPDFTNTPDYPVRIWIDGITRDATMLKINAFSTTSDLNEFLTVKERLVLRVVDAVAAAGASFAPGFGTVVVDPSETPFDAPHGGAVPASQG